MKRLATFAVFALLFGGLAYWLGPDLRDDISHRNDTFEPARDARIVEAKCKSRLFLFYFCDVKAIGSSLPQGSQEFSYFLLGGPGSEGIGLRRATGPEPAANRYLTTTIGTNYLPRRIISFLVLMAPIAALAFVSLFAKSGGLAQPPA